MSNKKYIEINIDGKNVDFSEEGLNLQLTFKNPCAGGFGEVQGNNSERSQTIPASKQNDEIFDNFWNVAQENETTGPIEKDSEIQVNGLNIFSGKAQMKKVSTNGRFYERQGKEYSVAFYGNNADWFELLKDKKIGFDLDWVGDLHDYTRTEVLNGWNANPALKNYCYIVAKFKDWYSDTATVPATSFVDVFQSTPAVFISALVTKIFNSIGYTLTPSFFSSPVVSRYIMPLILPEKYPQEFSEDYLNVVATKTITQTLPGTALLNITAVSYSNQTKTPPLAVPNPYIGSVASSVIIGVGNTGRYTAPYDGYYQFNMSVTIDNISGVGSFGISVLGNGLPNTTTDATFNIVVADNGKTFDYVVFAEMPAGGIAEFYAGGSAFLTFDIVGGSIEVIGEANIVKDTPVDFKYLFSDLLITDFIKGLTAAFNLCWDTDPDLKTVNVLPSDNYLITDRGAATNTTIEGFHQDTFVDSTHLQDLSKNGNVTAINNTKQTQYFKWKSDGSDTTQEGLNFNENIVLGAAKYNLPAGRFKPDTEQNENPFFAATVMFFDENIRHSSSELVPLLPLFWPADYREETTAETNTNTFAPRLLWFGGQRGLDGKIKYIDSSTGLVGAADLPAAFFVNYNDSSGLDVSLSFADKVINGLTVQGQLRRFYLNEMARLRVGKRVTEWLYIEEVYILDLSFQNKVLIGGNMYILEEVNSFNPLVDTSTKVVLLYDVRAEQQDINFINNTLALGVLSDYSNPE